MNVPRLILRSTAFALFMVVAFCRLAAVADASKKPRLLVLTDIGQDPDDLQSLVRLLVYADEFDIEGLIATSDNNYKHEPPRIHDDIIHKAIDRYAQVLPSLRRRRPDYPDAEALHRVVQPGNIWGGVAVPVADTIGEGRDTAGSNWIIRLADRDDARPLNVTIWGGACDLAQALWKVKKSRSKQQVDRFVSKLRVYAISDQDATSPWIREQFPNLFYIHGRAREGDSFQSAYRGIFLGGDYRTLSRDWLYAHVKRGHGPLGELYPDRAYTQKNPHGCIKEGDTPSWFYFLPLGLHDPAQPGYGGWGGRFGPEETYYQDLQDTVDGVTSYRATVWRWREHFQNDFAARMDWCVRDVDDANHAPAAQIDGDATASIVHRKVRAGEDFSVSATGSRNPDGNALTYHWWSYVEAGSYGERLDLVDTDKAIVRFKIPAVSSGKTIHLILEVQDDGQPPLVSYRRVVFEVE